MDAARTPSTTQNFTITFTETGLASGVNWSIYGYVSSDPSENGTVGGNTTSVVWSGVPNGTYVFDIHVVAYIPRPSAITVTVNGKSLSEAIVFSAAPSASFTVAPELDWGATSVLTLAAEGGEPPYDYDAEGFSIFGGFGSDCAQVVGITGPVTSVSCPMTPSKLEWAADVSAALPGALYFKPTSQSTPNIAWGMALAGNIGYGFSPAYEASGGLEGVASSSLDVNLSASQPDVVITANVSSVTGPNSTGSPCPCEFQIYGGGAKGPGVNETLSDTLQASLSLPIGVYFVDFTSKAGLPGSGGTLTAAEIVVGPSRPYNVTFQELFQQTYIPPGKSWTVEFNGTVATVASTSKTFSVFSGIYPYLITGPAGYRVSEFPPSGTVPLSGRTNTTANVTETFRFAQGATYSLTFAEKGLPKGQSWCVDVSGWVKCSTTSSVKYANLTPGSYAYQILPLKGQTIEAAAGTTALGLSGSLTVAKNLKVSLTYTYPYAVTFTETGLTTGTWSVTVKSATESSATGDPIVFHLANGTDSYKVGAETGYTSSGSPTKVKVSGAPVSVAVTFKAKSGDEPGPLEGLAGVRGLVPLAVRVGFLPQWSA